jgi:parallel beta-helix repeat protein
MKEFYTKVFRLKNVLSLAVLLLAGYNSNGQAYVVTTTADAGAGSLRQAILDANLYELGNPGAGQTITFNIAGAVPHVITTVTPLPAILATVAIDGYSQPGAAEGPIGTRTIGIQINGGGLANSVLVIGDGVSVGNNCTIVGLNIVNSGGDGIELTNFINGFRVWGCYFGTTPDGLSATAAEAIVGSAILLGTSPGPQGPTERTEIGISDYGFGLEGTVDANEGNVIGNSGVGINAIDQEDIRIRGNYVGIGADGLVDVGNAAAGIILNSFTSGGVVGVDDAETLVAAADCANYVGFNDEGITVRDGATGNIVAGNYVGLTPTLTDAGNASSGIIIEKAPGNRIGTDADGDDDALERNNVQNNDFGILLYNSLASTVGTVSSENNTIMGNTISNNGTGIKIDNVSAPDVPVTSNIIGSDGVGTNGTLEANIISFNQNGGVVFQDGAGTMNLIRISQNSFESNSGTPPAAGLSIAFNTIGFFEPIDCGDADGGPNGLLNRPIIQSVGSNNVDKLFIKGWAAPGAVLEFYVTQGSSTDVTTIPVGELKTYLYTAVEGSVDDLAAGTSASTDDGTGASCTLNEFSFEIPLSGLAGAFTIGDNIGALALSAATGAANTSDYSPLVLSILPVTYLSFTGTPGNNVVNLNWKTATESNSSHFDVQRSTDGSSYQTIGSVTAAGNSVTTKSYDFVDASPVKGAVAYYRLKQVDLDGKFEYSKVILVKATGSNNRFSFGPNPVKSSLVINLVSDEAQTLSVRLVDNSGRVVKAYNKVVTNGANQIQLNDLGSIPKGIYILQISGKSMLINEKVMKY